MPAEAQHADVHLAAAAHDRHVRGHRTVDERAALIRDGALNVLAGGAQDLPARGPVAEPLRRRARPLRLPGAQVAHQARQLPGRVPHPRRLRGGFPLAPQVLEGVGERVVDLNR